LFDVGGSMTVGPAAPDVLTGGMTPAEQTAAKRTVAWLEKWLIWAYQEIAELYAVIDASIAAGSWTNTYYRGTMALAAPLFGFTAPPTKPTFSDKVKVAAIHDRYLTMRSTMWSKAITINKVAAGPDT